MMLWVKTSGQMNGAARSARQNIIEASSRAATSKEQEIRQLDVAKGSLDELAGDYEAFLIDHDEIPWSINDKRFQTVKCWELDEFSVSKDVDHDFGVYILAMRKRCRPWLENEDPIIAANSLLIAIRRTSSLLIGQMRRTTDDFKKEGGFTENLSKIRLEYRDQNQNAPRCPKCNRPMRRVIAKRGRRAGQPFWGCTAYPECDGTLDWEDFKGTFPEKE